MGTTRLCNNSTMRYPFLLVLLTACAGAPVKLTDREPPGEIEPAPETAPLMGRAYEENLVARVAGGAPPGGSATGLRSVPPSSHPTPAPAPAGTSVASVVIHTPAGDMEVKCPDVCPPGQTCTQPAAPEAPSNPLKAAGTDLLKEVFTPLAAAAGGALVTAFVGRKKRNRKP